ncbi:TRAP transporter small permease [Pelagimonas varians]|uniref:TRAP transporter small permease protein n=1 Tax=Pelagimonas varians TaxID=696760 RepID=A0A238L3U6_9RHOB|nr:TRAP transporter small permease [Pelagimonas varians]PYG26495.1 TRAP-type C4-dicarboxylate transport system permease small subunit [Pelagimonas varians]SMX49657.1 Tripartite ATP-independent periplasmic transporters, DctQ component [Pelagimonas varians]
MLKRFENMLLGLAALAVLAMGAMITLNVVLRLFGTSLPDSVVLVRELMVAGILLPLAAVTAARAHVCVEVLTNRLPDRVTQFLILIGWFIGLIAFAPMVFAGWRELSATWSSGSFFFGDLSLPKWPGRLIFFVAMVAFWLRLLLVFKTDAQAFLRGEKAE